MFQSSFNAPNETPATQEHEARTAHRVPSDRATGEATGAHPEAVEGALNLSPARKDPRKSHSNVAGPVSPDSAEDRELLLALARLRFLSYSQIERRLLPGRSLQAIGQRVKRLTADGWVSTWDQPVKAGGKPRYVLPTKETLRWALGELRLGTRGTPLERLVDFMLPQRPRQTLELDPVSVPSFFAHQRESDDLVLTLETRGPAPVLWASTWERPFPNAASGLPMPQPDAVMVVDTGHGPRLVLLEHDRGMESLTHFKSAKVERYAELSVRPELCEALLGFREFEVWVSVLDKRFRRPLERLSALSRLATLEGAEELMRFTLAGWLNDAPDERIWFENGVLPEGASLRPVDHETVSAWEMPTPEPHDA